MNEAPTQDDLPSIARAIRFAFAAVISGVSFPNICCALSLPHIQQIFRDMLGDEKNLRGATNFVIHNQSYLLAVSIVIPIVAIALCFTSRLAHSIYISGALVMASFVQFFFTLHAIFTPLLIVAGGMKATSQ